MKVDKKSLMLYAVTDRTWLGSNSLASQVEQSIKAGVTFVQLREKNLDHDEFVKQALEVKKITDKYDVPFVINDNIEVALACGADGVHVGQDDMAAVDVRRLLGTDKIIGVSVRTVEQALFAQKNGADYLGVGAMFTTSTKLDANSASYDELKAICGTVSIPVVAIGGINEGNILKLRGSGTAGVAVVSAIFARPDIYAATKKLAELAGKLVSET